MAQALPTPKHERRRRNEALTDRKRKANRSSIALAPTDDDED